MDIVLYGNNLSLIYNILGHTRPSETNNACGGGNGTLNHASSRNLHICDQIVWMN